MNLKEKQIIYAGGKPHTKCNVIMLSSNEKATDLPFNVGITLCNDGKLRIGNPVGNSEKRQHLYFISDEEIKEGDWFCYHNKVHLCKQTTEESIVSNTAGVCNRSACKKIIATTDDSLISSKLFPVGEELHSITNYIPQIPQQFIQQYIEEYNKGNVITEVEVEVVNLKNIYITQDDLDSLNCTDFSKVSNKYGFKHVEDFFDAMNENLFLIDGYKVFSIKQIQIHDIYPDYLKGEFLFKITEFEKDYQLKINPDNTINIKPIKDSWSREEVIEFAYKLLKATGKEIKAEMVEIHTNPHIIFSEVDEWIDENL